jgi:hypothetical protein
MRRILFSALAALTLAGCFAHDEYRDREYRGADGRVYRHERWHGDDVYYRHEDGRWYSRRGNDWVIRADVDLR